MQILCIEYWNFVNTFSQHPPGLHGYPHQQRVDVVPDAGPGLHELAAVQHGGVAALLTVDMARAWNEGPHDGS